MIKSVTQIPASMTEVDLKTGAETHKPMAWNVLPPAAGKCRICTVDHPRDLPHNAQSLFYQMTFSGVVGRPPTWADALAHCSDETQRQWKEELGRRSAWTEPPIGEAPVRDHGID